MIFNPTNIEEKLRLQQSKQIAQPDILKQVQAIFEADNLKETIIKNELKSGNDSSCNHFNIDLLASDRIFHIDSIKKTCIDYRLRFLDTKYFFPHLKHCQRNFPSIFNWYCIGSKQVVHCN